MEETKCVLCNSRNGNSFRVAKLFGWEILAANEFPDLTPYKFIVVICANTGDEELQPEMEEFLLTLDIQNIKYAVCELGNYFGYERDCFGCKTIVRSLLTRLGWKEVADISIDSLPDLDINAANQWVDRIHEITKDNSKK